MPRRDLRHDQVGDARPLDEIDVFQQAAARLRQIGMGIESCIQKSDGDAAPAKLIRRIEAARRRHDLHFLLGERRILGR